MSSRPAPAELNQARSALAALGTRLRRRGRVRAVIYLSAAVALIAAAAVTVTLTGGQAGKPAPLPVARNFSLKLLGHPGSDLTLNAYAGRPLIINFFASWCTPCQRETPMLARFYSAQHGRVLVIGVDSNDQAAAALRFVHKTGVRYPVVADPYPSPATVSYGVYALPQTFFLDARHRIVWHVVGPLTAKDLAKGATLMDQHRG